MSQGIAIKEYIGGQSRNRTGDSGVAVRCITTLLSGQYSLVCFTQNTNTNQPNRFI